MKATTKAKPAINALLAYDIGDALDSLSLRSDPVPVSDVQQLLGKAQRVTASPSTEGGVGW